MYQNDSDHYYIHLEEFQGPFDLLLFFIERDELDIYDIPISKISDDFLDYIKKMESLNITLASEFIYMAAQLMKLKASSLLPRLKQATEEEGEDPKEELIQRLIQYKRFKEISRSLEAKAEIRSMSHARGSLEDEIDDLRHKSMIETEWESLSLYNLLKTFNRLIENLEKEEKFEHQIADIGYTVDDQKEYIISRFSYKKSLNFTDLFGEVKSKMEAIVTFLALLELINNQLIKIRNGSEMNEFTLEQVNPYAEADS